MVLTTLVLCYGPMWWLGTRVPALWKTGWGQRLLVGIALFSGLTLILYLTTGLSWRGQWVGPALLVSGWLLLGARWFQAWPERSRDKLLVLGLPVWYPLAVPLAWLADGMLGAIVAAPLFALLPGTTHLQNRELAIRDVATGPLGAAQLEAFVPVLLLLERSAGTFEPDGFDPWSGSGTGPRITWAMLQPDAAGRPVLHLRLAGEEGPRMLPLEEAAAQE